MSTREITTKEYETMMSEEESKINAKLEEVNAAIKDGKSAVDVQKILAELAELEDGYTVIKNRKEFIARRNGNIPMLEAFRNDSFNTIGHSPVYNVEKTAVIRYEKKTDAEKKLDLHAFAEFAGVDKEWERYARYLYRICVILAQKNLVANSNSADVEELVGKYELHDIEKKLAEVGLISGNQSAVSVAAAKKVLQKILDIVCFVSSEKKPDKNKYNVGSSNVNYLVEFILQDSNNDPGSIKKISIKKFINKMFRGCLKKVVISANDKERYDYIITHKKGDDEESDYKDFIKAFTVEEPEEAAGK